MEGLYSLSLQRAMPIEDSVHLHTLPKFQLELRSEDFCQFHLTYPNGFVKLQLYFENIIRFNLVIISDSKGDFKCLHY